MVNGVVISMLKEFATGIKSGRGCEHNVVLFGLSPANAVAAGKEWWIDDPWYRMVPMPLSPSDYMQARESHDGMPLALSANEAQALSAAQALRAPYFRAVGNAIGLCLLHGSESKRLRLPVYFCRHVYKFMLGRRVEFADYAFYDPKGYHDGLPDGTGLVSMLGTKEEHFAYLYLEMENAYEVDEKKYTVVKRCAIHSLGPPLQKGGIHVLKAGTGVLEEGTVFESYEEQQVDVPGFQIRQTAHRTDQGWVMPVESHGPVSTVFAKN